MAKAKKGLTIRYDALPSWKVPGPKNLSEIASIVLEDLLQRQYPELVQSCNRYWREVIVFSLPPSISCTAHRTSRWKMCIDILKLDAIIINGQPRRNELVNYSDDTLSIGFYVVIEPLGSLSIMPVEQVSEVVTHFFDRLHDKLCR